MGSTFSVPSVLKSPLSYFTGDGDDGESVDWTESESAYVLRVSVPLLKKGDLVNATVVQCEGHVMKLSISGKITCSGKKFSKLVKLPENGGLFHQAYVIVHDSCVVVTIPKAEEV
ncbi:uncharacterized protein LOC141646508 [Silene latifolia]|uniref:uncharacterized protein LOC141646508 n=1 Tax=Silene latifolia TaxID=37657 RepID=UPI003D771485